MKKKQLISAAAGALDPVLKKLAQELASCVPEKSILKNAGFETAMGVIKGFVEATADDLPLASWLAIEKTTDFFDFFSGALGQKNQNAKVSLWMDSFFREASDRIKTSEDPKSETEKINLEFELRKKLLEKIGESKTDVSDQATIQWQKLLEKITTAYQKSIANLDAAASKAETWADTKKRKKGYGK